MKIVGKGDHRLPLVVVHDWYSMVKKNRAWFSLIANFPGMLPAFTNGFPVVPINNGHELPRMTYQWSLGVTDGYQ